MLITRTPLRISLLGGGTDVKEFYTRSPGAVVSFAVNLYIYVAVNKKFDGKFRVSYSQTENVDTLDEIRHDLVRESLRAHNIKTGLEVVTISDIPGSGTGLGSSSALTVGLVKALAENIHPSALAERAWTIEAEKCFHPVGKQDHYASAHGALNMIEFAKNSVRVNSIPFSSNWQREFESHSLLLWTGIARSANKILADQRKGFEKSIDAGIELADLTRKFYNQMLDFDFLEGMPMVYVGDYLNKAWELKKKFAEGISNEDIDLLYETGRNCGAYGGKLLGAGGGGFMFFIAPPETHERILLQTGLRQLKFKIENEGSKIIYGE